MSKAKNNKATDNQKAKSSLWAAFLGFFVDMFDVYLPIVALGPAMVYFQPKDLPATVTVTIYYVVFAISLIGRPLGAAIFGHYADKIGRKKTTLISIAGFGVGTLLIGLLPGYEQIGIWAIVLLILLRFVDGIFLGGEYTAASPLAMENSPHEKRGLYSGIILAGFPAAYVSISLVTATVMFFVPIGDASSPYVMWGWRIPFFIGALLAFAYVIYFSKHASESDLWLEGQNENADNKVNAAKEASPLKELFKGESGRNFLQVFVLMSGIWFTFNSIASALPGILTNYLKISGTTVTSGLLIINVILIFTYILGGMISQKVGRKPFLVTMGLITTVIGTVLYFNVIRLAVDNIVLALTIAGIMQVLCMSVWGAVTAYITERFKTGVRASGFGLGYSLAVIIPSCYSFIMLGLANFMPYQYTPVVLLGVGGILTVIGAAWGPETRDVLFHEEGSTSIDQKKLHA
ncbi:MFS transporter [Peribacillus saganii]|uniref:MFS transporter n=1 Tax=Peribacillus saganii TaxID=2303992 RepID=A0A372LRP6_9BACI|nr:MFS transporter [Peribacillus saganii]RFU70893.1 MFS transporter [Peribacillus saganii]